MIAYYTHRHATSTDLLPDTAISTIDITRDIYMHTVTRVCMCIHKFIIILQLHTNIYDAGRCGCDECGYFNC